MTTLLPLPDSSPEPCFFPHIERLPLASSRACGNHHSLILGWGYVLCCLFQTGAPPSSYPIARSAAYYDRMESDSTSFLSSLLSSQHNVYSVHVLAYARTSIVSLNSRPVCACASASGCLGCLSPARSTHSRLLYILLNSAKIELLII